MSLRIIVCPFNIILFNVNAQSLSQELLLTLQQMVCYHLLIKPHVKISAQANLILKIDYEQIQDGCLSFYYQWLFILSFPNFRHI